MTDYFALFDQPRAPWLDSAALKEIFHRKTLEEHPDTAGPGSENRFAALNEAYQVLQDPKRRLQHLLELEGAVPSRASQTIPNELEELFLRIGERNQRARRLLEQIHGASTVLERSLLKPQVLEVQKAIEDLRHQVRNLDEDANRELKEIDAKQIDAISQLHSRFAYLGRWSAQLDELAFQLSL
ncbi:MAG TPA: DnaJ domain-containing protein [Chthoniobacterales bacterium]|nr:DnaJ domain-containing protein [Chthoniobacterales bacterium]